MNEFEREFDLQDRMRLSKEVSEDVIGKVGPAVWAELKHLRLRNAFWLYVAWRGLQMSRQAFGDLEQMFLDGKIVRDERA